MKEKIKSYLEDQFMVEFGSDGIDENSNLFEAEVIDSFGMVEMISFLEKNFQVKFVDEDLMSPMLNSLNGIVQLVQEKGGGN